MYFWSEAQKQYSLGGLNGTPDRLCPRMNQAPEGATGPVLPDVFVPAQLLHKDGTNDACSLRLGVLIPLNDGLVVV